MLTGGMRVAGDLAVGATTVTASALVDMVSTTRGVTVPRMSEAQRDAISSPTIGLMIYNTDSDFFNFYDGVWKTLGVPPQAVPTGGSTGEALAKASGADYDTVWAAFYPSTTTLDAIVAPVADVSLNSHKITNLTTPTIGSDAANKTYVDSVAAGLSWKMPVRAATTIALTLATDFENGDTVDGVVLATADRILVKNQYLETENGIYLVNASGAPTRAPDADSGAELLAAAAFVEEGTTNKDTAWVCTTDAPITVGSSSIVFVQFSGVSYMFTSGVQSSGSTVSANVDNVTIEVNGSNQLQVKAGGTARKFVGTITGDSSTTAFGITHSLGTKDVVVSIRGTSSPYTDTIVYADVATTSTSVATVTFASAPATGVNFSVTVLA